MITRQTEKEALKHCKPMRLKLKIQSKRELIEKLKRSLENDIAMAKILDEHKIQLQNEKVPSDPSEKYIEYLTAKVKTHG
jgi:mannose/fructose/N-acetylgalactosamine-specific phosphotransferase system component IIB